MGKRDAKKYFVELSTARGKLRSPGPDKLKKWLGPKFTPRKAPDDFGFQLKPSKEKAKIIRKILKQAHPETKFSVRTKGYTTVNVNWKDGPSMPTMEKLGLKRMQEYVRDGQGGTKPTDYIFLNREYSKKIKDAETKRILGKYADASKYNQLAGDTIVYREMRQTDYPGARSPGLAKTAGVARHPKKV